jgi:hypothetical protein
MKVSVKGGGLARWRCDSLELFFVSYDRKLMSADVATVGGNLQVGVPKTLFQTQMKTDGSYWPYDISASRGAETTGACLLEAYR